MIGDYNNGYHCFACNAWVGHMSTSHMCGVFHPTTVTISPPLPQWRDGWVCPVCNKGISPDINICPCTE